MPSTTAATALIHFIGIVVFSRELSPDHHLQALMPRISGSGPIVRRAAVGTHPPLPLVSVESHTAFIAFATCDYVSSTGWAPAGMETVPGQLFVRLDGERITIIPSIGPARSTDVNSRRQPLPSTFEAGNSNELLLPHLQKTCCPAMTKLKPDFQPPDFRGAAAVFDIPYGNASACGANAPGVQWSRIDTRVTIDNDGYLTISAKKDNKTKEIRLRGGAQVYVANLPSDFLEPGVHTHIASAPHFMAYFQMSESPNSCSNWTVPVVKPCATPSLWREGIQGTPPPVPPGTSTSILEFARVDFECSNSLWP